MCRFARKFVLLLAGFVLVVAHPAAADGGITLKVNCGGRGPLSTISGALKLLDPRGPSTVIVSGACRENVAIQGFDRLTLQAAPGASISDPSGGAAEAVGINDSQRVTVQGFTINGAVGIGNGSSCNFSGNTIVGPDGVSLFRSQAYFQGDVIQGGPLAVLNASSVGAIGLTVQGSSDVGIQVRFGSFLRLEGGLVTASAGDGIAVGGGSSLLLAPGNSINNNAGAGVSVGEVSFAQFRAGNVVTGNGGSSDVVCGPQFSATRGAVSHIGGGTTNCVEP
jgi:hypothetical protein